MNEEITKGIMSEKKTPLPSLKNQDWKTVKTKTEKNKQIINIYLNERHLIIKRTHLYRSKISL